MLNSDQVRKLRDIEMPPCPKHNQFEQTQNMLCVQPRCKDYFTLACHQCIAEDHNDPAHSVKASVPVHVFLNKVGELLTKPPADLCGLRNNKLVSQLHAAQEDLRAAQRHIGYIIETISQRIAALLPPEQMLGDKVKGYVNATRALVEQAYSTNEYNTLKETLQQMRQLLEVNDGDNYSLSLKCGQSVIKEIQKKEEDFLTLIRVVNVHKREISHHINQFRTVLASPSEALRNQPEDDGWIESHRLTMQIKKLKEDLDNATKSVRSFGDSQNDDLILNDKLNQRLIDTNLYINAKHSSAALVDQSRTSTSAASSVHMSRQQLQNLDNEPKLNSSRYKSDSSSFLEVSQNINQARINANRFFMDYFKYLGNRVCESKFQFQLKEFKEAKYLGQLNAQGQEDGVGLMLYHSGQLQIAEYRSGNLHGKSIVLFDDGDMYVGDYREHRSYGVGSFYWKNGDFYHGQWKNNLRNGKGSFVWNDGYIFDGEWEGGQRHGKGQLLQLNGAKFEQVWENDNKVSETRVR